MSVMHHLPPPKHWRPFLNNPFERELTLAILLQIPHLTAVQAFYMRLNLNRPSNPSTEGKIVRSFLLSPFSSLFSFSPFRLPPPPFLLSDTLLISPPFHQSSRSSSGEAPPPSATTPSSSPPFPATPSSPPPRLRTTPTSSRWEPRTASTTRTRMSSSRSRRPRERRACLLRLIPRASKGRQTTVSVSHFPALLPAGVG